MLWDPTSHRIPLLKGKCFVSKLIDPVWMRCVGECGDRAEIRVTDPDRRISDVSVTAQNEPYLSRCTDLFGELSAILHDLWISPVRSRPDHRVSEVNLRS